MIHVERFLIKFLLCFQLLAFSADPPEVTDLLPSPAILSFLDVVNEKWFQFWARFDLLSFTRREKGSIFLEMVGPVLDLRNLQISIESGCYVLSIVLSVCYKIPQSQRVNTRTVDRNIKVFILNFINKSNFDFSPESVQLNGYSLLDLYPFLFCMKTLDDCLLSQHLSNI